MAEAPSLGDFFKSKGKKKIKATNLNKETAAAKPDDPKAKKATEDDAWQEEQVAAQTMKVQVVGNLMRDEEKKDEDDVVAPAWGATKKDGGASKRADLTDKKYPSLAKSVASVNIDDGSDNKVNIATSKNVFAALEGDEEDDETGTKRPKAINSSMVSKKKGEFEKVALKREVDKYAKKDAKKAKKAEGSEEEEEDEEDEDEEAEQAAEDEHGKTAEELLEEEEKRREKRLKKKQEAKKEVEEDVEEVDNVPEDLKMQPDLKAAKEKYTGRKRLPRVDLPRSEMQEQKENKPANQQSGGKKKKFAVEEETEKKIAYAD